MGEAVFGIAILFLYRALSFHYVYIQVLFSEGKFQWKRLENLIGLAREGSGGLDLSDTVKDGARVLLLDDKLRRQLLLALTEDDRLHVEVKPPPPPRL